MNKQQMLKALEVTFTLKTSTNVDLDEEDFFSVLAMLLGRDYIPYGNCNYRELLWTAYSKVSLSDASNKPSDRDMR